ncbi:unnamed protein product [Rotaria sp. Silwood2]|nr:unnamed protein product [Rotaria sp. Silwood2]CAF2731410.1 unnamed protein product [Rotaria sp. Silwood2]CAF2972040.1 unnamed protein product [Rotaria sp. Silwood2]CAF3111531.1 unnamed protein product [Rotaria sp. Silwood2]CAF4016439.1 unnamed protein product [Rotaria sp. Silwood2]
MGLHPRECLNHYHLICLTGLVAISLTLVIVGGSLSAWCIRYGNAYECHSLFHSDRAFSCLFKLIPTGIIFCLIISLFMFIILIIGQVCIEYSGIAKKEYQLVARIVNILTLSIAIILIMIVLLQWFHPPRDSSKNILVAMMPLQDETNNASKPKQERIIFATIAPDHSSYLKAIGVRHRSMLTYHQNIHHGPNLFFAAFIILFIALLGFAMAHRI